MILYPQCPADTAGKILHAKSTMVFRNMEYDFNNLKKDAIPCAKAAIKSSPKDRLTQCLEFMNFMMEKEDRRFYKGIIVGKPRGSIASYTEEIEVRTYLNELCTNEEYSAIITSQLNAVVNFLTTNPTYGGLRHIQRDMTLIEVNYY